VGSAAQSAQGGFAALAGAICRVHDGTRCLLDGAAASRLRACEDGQENRYLSGHSKDAKVLRSERESPTLLTLAGDSVFMRKKLEAVRRELQAGNGVDATQYRALQNVRARVNERYRDAIQWLRSRGWEEEARRFELMQRNLAPVKTENQLIADTLVAHNEGRTMDGQEQRASR